MKPKVVSPGVVELVRNRKDGFGLIMRAENVRQAHTGLHATLTLLGSKPGSKPQFLAGTTCNITRDEERTKLLNTARRQATPQYEEHLFGPPEDKVLVKRDFDLFCFSIWDTLMSVEKPMAVSGQMLGPMEFILKPLVLQHGGTILFGPGGSGKSTTAFLAAIAADSGANGDKAIWEAKQTRTLYGNLERSHESIVRRIFAVNCALGLEPDRPLDVLTARGKSLLSIEPVIRKHIQEEGIEFFILDSISRARMGKLTDDDTANTTIDILNSFGIAWLAIGHVSKDNQNETFGSVHYGNGADITVKLKAEKRGSTETGVYLETTKANDIAFPPPMTLAYKFDQDYGLHTAGIAKPDDYPDLAQDMRTLPQKVNDHLLDTGKASATKVALALGVDRSNVARILNADDRFISLGRQGKEILYAVVAREEGRV